MHKLSLFVLILMGFNSTCFATEGLIKIKSQFSTDETLDNFKAILAQKGMTLFAVVDHQQGANKVGLELLPTTVVIFGNPKVGTLLMQCSQSIGIDLPQKTLIWEDKQGAVWLAYNNPQFLIDRHAVTDCKKPLNKISHALAAFAKAATSK